MKTLFYCIAIFFSVIVTAQENTVVDKLKDYYFSTELLAKGIGGMDVNADYSFTVTMASSTGSEKIVERASYDVNKAEGTRWTLLSYNGMAPSKKELKAFKKEHNFKEEEITATIDDTSWDIELDNDKYLEVSFKYNPSTLKRRTKYFADIMGKAYFNKNTKRLEKTEYINDKPTKIKPFTVSEFYMVVNYVFNETEDKYQVESEEINMDAKMFGEVVPVKHIYEYSNYSKNM